MLMDTQRERVAEMEGHLQRAKGLVYEFYESSDEAAAVIRKVEAAPTAMYEKPFLKKLAIAFQDFYDASSDLHAAEDAFGDADATVSDLRLDFRRMYKQMTAKISELEERIAKLEMRITA